MKKDLRIFEFIRGKPFLSLIIGGVILVLGILLSDIPTMIVSPEWPTTEGIVISQRLVGQKFKEYDGDYYENIDGYIRYQYSVNGISYSSLAVNSIDSPFYPEIIARRYPKGKNVNVYYNPKKPSEAVLEPGIVLTFKAFNVDSLFISGAGLYFIALGISELLKRIRLK